MIFVLMALVLAACVRREPEYPIVTEQKAQAVQETALLASAHAESAAVGVLGAGEMVWVYFCHDGFAATSTGYWVRGADLAPDPCR